MKKDEHPIWWTDQTMSLYHLIESEMVKVYYRHDETMDNGKLIQQIEDSWNRLMSMKMRLPNGYQSEPIDH